MRLLSVLRNALPLVLTACCHMYYSCQAVCSHFRGIILCTKLIFQREMLRKLRLLLLVLHKVGVTERDVMLTVLQTCPSLLMLMIMAAQNGSPCGPLFSLW